MDPTESCTKRRREIALADVAGEGSVLIGAGVMDLTESRTKRRRKIAVADVDRISLLPDNLLILILSLLSTKEAVHTSLLAKGFQNLWAAVPVLHFDFDEFCPDDDILDDLDDEGEKKLWELHAEKFKKFGDGVLKHRDQLINVDSFTLKWVEEETDPDPASAWLDIVSELNLKFLSVHIFSEEYDFEVPDSIFSCKSLQEMELNMEHEPIMPISVNLPCLKKLTLHYTVIKDEIMQKLSALPALEEMVLSYCYLNFCHISSGTLKRLVLDGNYNDNETAITISTPSLLYLEVVSWTMGTIKFKKLESLVKACIHYHEDSLFLTALSNASYLELMLSKSGVLQMKDALKEETTGFPTFNNLKTLKIGEWCMTDEFDVVDRFLIHARNLEKLNLLHCRQERNKESVFNLINLLQRTRKIWTVNPILNRRSGSVFLELFNEINPYITTRADEFLDCKKRGSVGDEIQMKINLELVGNKVNILHDDKIKDADITELVKRVSDALLLLG